MKIKSELVYKASEYIFNLFKDKLAPQYVYHNYRHAEEIASACKEIAERHEISQQELEILLLAAWFHDTGYIDKYEGHELISAEIAREFLTKENFDAGSIDKVCDLIKSTNPGHKPTDLFEEIIHDADYISVGKKSFFNKGELLRIEWENFLKKKFNEEEWAKSQLEFLLSKNFYTQYAVKAYGPQREKNIERQRQKIRDLPQKKEKKTEPKSGRGVETMFRSTYRNHIELSAIADSKANMMISINTIIMSVIISVVGGGITFLGKSEYDTRKFAIPIVLLLLTCLLSVVFAVLSARPKVTSKATKKDKTEKKRSVLFFGNFTKLELPVFVKEMTGLMQNKDELYNNMIVDIYYLGKVLNRKYIMLRISYLIFLLGFILSVISFLIVYLYYQQIYLFS